MYRYQRRIVMLACTILIFNESYAQFFAPKHYPQQYFQWPVGAKIALAANFGELRPNHYHMGLDCKTDQKINVPVYAAAAGYISRVKIEPFGFGRSISINHPNGFTTLYAHLNDFYPALEKYIKEQQYRQQQWAITISMPENLFPVNKGEFIAYSGNTGGSQGPHLHFEIRDTKTDKVLNPLLFGFPIPDKIEPQILRLAVYDRRISTYEQAPRIYSLKKTGSVYRTTVPVIVNTDKVSFAITAYDRYTGSTNQNGIYKAILFRDGNIVSGFEMDGISYDETRYLNAHIDYRTRSGGGPYLEHVSRLPGYWEGIYKDGESDGVIIVEGDSSHNIRIQVTDANENSSILEFTLKGSGQKSSAAPTISGPVFHPGLLNVFDNDKVKFYLAGNMLYDSFHFKYNEMQPATGNTIYQLHNNSVPLHGYFPVRIKADVKTADTGRVIMKRFYANKDDYKKAVYENGWYKASFREFGHFQLLIDSIAPVITPIGFTNGMHTAGLRSIKFKVLDETEDLKKFTGLLDGKWILFSNDKGKVFVYEFDEYCGAGPHELILIAEDMAGNKTEKKFQFTR